MKKLDFKVDFFLKFDINMKKNTLKQVIITYSHINLLRLNSKYFHPISKLIYYLNWTKKKRYNKKFATIKSRQKTNANR